jgi:hypothetical protein
MNKRKVQSGADVFKIFTYRSDGRDPAGCSLITSFLRARERIANRNAGAAQQLLDSHTEISDGLWNKLSPPYDESDARWRAAVSETNRDVVFKNAPAIFRHGSLTFGQIWPVIEWVQT